MDNTIIQGQSQQISVTISDANGAPIDLALSAQKVQIALVQNNTVVHVYALNPGPDESSIHIDPANSSRVILRVEASVTDQLVPGAVELESAVVITDGNWPNGKTHKSRKVIGQVLASANRIL